MRNISAVQRPIPLTEGELADDLGVGQPAEPIELHLAGQHLVGQVTDRRRLVGRQPRGPELVDGQREHRLRGRVAVERGHQPSVDGARRRARELLEADLPHQFGEVACGDGRARRSPAGPADSTIARNAGWRARQLRARFDHICPIRHVGHRSADGCRREQAGSLRAVRRSRLLPLPGAAAIVFACVLLLASCGGGGGGSAAPAGEPRASGPDHDRRAESATSPSSPPRSPPSPRVGIYATPQSPPPAEQLPNPWLVDPQVPTSKVAQVFLVQSQQDGWVQVLLPVRPNGSTGWVKASDVDITQNTFHIVVALGAHTITVTNRGQPIYQGPVAVGPPTRRSPTPASPRPPRPAPTTSGC